MDLVKRANQLLAAKKFGELDLVIDELRPEDPQIAEELCLQKWAILGDTKELEKCFDEYLDRFDKVPNSNRLTAAALKHDLEKYDEALTIAERVFETEASNFSAAEMIFSCAVNTQQAKLALRVASTMVDEAERLNQPEAVVLDYKVKQLMGTALVGLYPETLGIWDELLPHFEKYPELLTANVFACVLRSLDGVGNVTEALRVIEEYGLEADDFPTTHELEMVIPQIFMSAGQDGRALNAYHELLEKYQDRAEPRWNYSLGLLSTGRLREGFEHFEIRWEWSDFPSKKRLFSSPRWEGESLEGKSILVWGEQGVGDQLLFLSLLPFVMDKSPADLTIEVSYKLIKLVKAWYPEATVRGDDVVDTVGQSVYDQLDYQIPSGSLMRLVVNSTGKIDVNKRLMRLKQEAKDAFLPDHLLEKRVIVGLSWRSTLITETREFNYMSVLAAEEIVTSLPDDVGFICLQYAMTDDEKEVMKKYDNVLVPEEDFFDDIFSNAYHTGCCDVVVTAGTIVVQLAGIFGVPVLTWLPKRDWVLLGQEHYPWFDNMLVVRGDANWDKESMLAELKRKLKIMLRIDRPALH
jgi:tetratricopeptide (TPR) repeat protein